MDLNGAVAIVTGASKGIGSAVARALSREGVKVVLAARNSESLIALRSIIETEGGIARAVPTDVSSEHDVKHLVEETLGHFGTINILINNAGVGVYTNVIDMKTSDFDAMMNVNLRGTFLCSREVLPVMMKQRSGEIINIASLAGKNSFAGGSVYSASKWGLIGFGRSLMLEVREHNIRVVTVCPGSVNTRFADNDIDRPGIIQPDDVAHTVVFALTMPNRVNVSEIDIRPTIKPR